jgi:1,2-diacylglycerol 3-beta-glucosyltransferase
MSENSWPENDSFKEFDVDLSGGLSGGTLAAPFGEEFDELEIDPAFLRGLSGRRLKSALVALFLWALVYFLHQVSWGDWFVYGLSGLMAIHCLRAFAATANVAVAAPLAPTDAHPMVSLMVAAKNEEAVIGRLAEQLCGLDYPADRYEVWVIDDASTDRTPQLLDELAQKYPQLKVFHRSPGAGGGKSGALNQALPLTKGEFLGVFDADAQIDPDFLRWMLPTFGRERVGAIQLRKAIIQAEKPSADANNLWIWGQQAEMAVDAIMRQQQVAIGGLGELRGNGQFVRRSALQECGGWNEETITDDLDLTLRLHLNNWDIECLSTPPVYEEGVTNAMALWHQRSRWAEGGYQRYIDYWRLIVSNRMGTPKTFDLFVFLIMQYVVPIVTWPDFVLSVMQHRLMMLTPISTLTFSFFIICALRGLRRPPWAESVQGKGPAITWRWELGKRLRLALWGLIYMFHWLPVISLAILRMSVLPKRLKWVKTVHQGVE